MSKKRIIVEKESDLCAVWQMITEVYAKLNEIVQEIKRLEAQNGSKKQ